MTDEDFEEMEPQERLRHDDKVKEIKEEREKDRRMTKYYIGEIIKEGLGT